ncbi:carbohydrate ABC transporter permease [Pseudogracilibacillus auburnensis]|uniref:Carbohydrate ABC transporter membrane protein 1 (CUT1 family) n=1 Tax=Pseudogracilibacillus auburnensis TaxID=1494959 RepID=A0A2V3W4Z2_9BACI|nr:sugar ABC transporter permease [Pseudogracilibacillus auburnensis]PXW89423.1 carbohydrate ABC transporter membrane protein 1 (CUT1 family) [Pseudogracilibacillus auburnensis]
MIRNYLNKNPHFIYIMPAIILLGILTLIPTIFLYFISMTDYELGSPSFNFVWFDNYTRLLLESDEFWHSLRISVFFSVIVTSIQLVLGFFLAKLLDRPMRFKFLVFACLIIPIAMTPSITGQIWKLMLNAEYGVINYLLSSLTGLKVIWLSTENAFLSTMLVDIWQNTPFVALIIYAGLKSLPEDPYEAAVMDGASKFQLFRHITLPLLKPIILLAIIFRLIDSLRTFDIPFSLTQGGPGNATEFLSLHIYRLGFAQTGWIGRASATSVILLIITTVISLILIRMLRKGVQDTE